MERLLRLSHPGLIALLLALGACTDNTATDDDATPGEDDDNDATSGDDDDDATPGDDDDDAWTLPETYRGLYVGMQMSSSGTPVVAYYDRDFAGIGIGIRKGDAWTRYAPPELGNPAGEGKTEGVDFGRYLSLVVSGSTWHLAFQDAEEEVLMYASSKDGITWAVETADSEGKGGMFTSLALDSSGNPAICHYDRDSNALRLARKSGASWSAAVVDEGTPGVDAEGAATDPDTGKYCSLAADGPNWRIAYYDAANGDLKLATGGSGPFTIATVDANGDTGAWPTQFKASSGWIIAFHDVEKQDLKLARENGGSWALEIVDNGEYVGADTAIVEASGKLSIAYFDGVNNDVKLATDTGSGWGIRTVGGGAEETEFNGATGYSNNLLADGSGNLHIASFRYDLGNFVYARTSP